MAGFVRGDVVVLPFPYSDLTQTKRRPAVVIKPLAGEDVILCQITSKALRDGYAIALENSDFTAGKLSQSSNIRPNRLFTADSNIILYRVGSLTKAKTDAVVEAIVQLLQSG